MATTTGYIDFTELGATPSTPSANHWRIYTKSDGFYIVDDAGTASGPFPTSALSNPMTTAQDIIVGGASGTPGRLALGAAGGHVSRINGAVAWNSGTSFPSAATGDRYWRTDTGLEYYYDGTRWVTTQLFAMVPTATTVLAALTTSSNVGRIGTAFGTGTDLWVVSSVTQFFVASGGTALSASHKWVGTVAKLDTTNTGAGTYDTISVDSGASAAWRTNTTAVGALLGTAATYPAINFSWAKTGTPGSLTVVHTLTCRIVQT